MAHSFRRRCQWTQRSYLIWPKSWKVRPLLVTAGAYQQSHQCWMSKVITTSGKSYQTQDEPELLPRGEVTAVSCRNCLQLGVTWENLLNLSHTRCESFWPIVVRGLRMWGRKYRGFGPSISAHSHLFYKKRYLRHQAKLESTTNLYLVFKDPPIQLKLLSAADLIAI